MGEEKHVAVNEASEGVDAGEQKALYWGNTKVRVRLLCMNWFGNATAGGTESVVCGGEKIQA